MIRVLLVDDDKESTDSLAQWLSFHGYETQVCYDGLDALETAQRFRPDVMLIDIILPGMDGFQLADRLREIDDLNDSVLIAVTGMGDSETRTPSQKAKFSMFFSKPVDLDLLDALLGALAKKKMVV